MALENPPFFWKMFPLKAPFLSGISRPAPEGRILRRSGHLFQQNSGAAPEGVTLKRHKVGATLRPGNFLGLAMKNHHTSHSHSSTCRSFRLDVDPWIFQTFALLISLRNCTTGE